MRTRTFSLRAPRGGSIEVKIWVGAIIAGAVLLVFAYNGYLNGGAKAQHSHMDDAEELIAQAFGDTRERDIGWAETYYKDTVGFIETHKPYARRLPAYKGIRTLEARAYSALAKMCLAQGRQDETIEWIDKYLEAAPRGDKARQLRWAKKLVVEHKRDYPNGRIYLDLDTGAVTVTSGR